VIAFIRRAHACARREPGTKTTCTLVMALTIRRNTLGYHRSAIIPDRKAHT
jgi:hypothetical protein